MRFFSRRTAVPPEIAAATVPAERPLVAAPAEDDIVLAASRFGLWVARDGVAQRWDWPVVSKATLRDRRLSITVAQEVTRWPSTRWHEGIAVLVDGPVRQFVLLNASGITDLVHTRVRRSVAESRQVPGLGWVVLRRIPGQDGLFPQVRLDPGVDPADPRLPDVADRTAQSLAPAAVED